VSCGNVLGSKYEAFNVRVRERKTAKGLDVTKVVYLTKSNFDKTDEGEVLDELRLFSVCCRKAMLTFVEID
jgi:DNA-directed RNA polymerase subunit N (RpoN/RPB10)